MFSSIRIAILLFFISICGAGYWYIGKLQGDLDIARANVAKMEVAVATSEESIKNLQGDMVKMAELNGKLQQDLQKAEAYSDSLREKFSRLDLVKDALKDAKNLEGRMNGATAKLWREIMADTGSTIERPLPNWLQQPKSVQQGTREGSGNEDREGSGSDSSTSETNPAQ